MSRRSYLILPSMERPALWRDATSTRSRKSSSLRLQLPWLLKKTRRQITLALIHGLMKMLATHTLWVNFLLRRLLGTSKKISLRKREPSSARSTQALWWAPPLPKAASNQETSSKTSLWARCREELFHPLSSHFVMWEMSPRPMSKPVSETRQRTWDLSWLIQDLSEKLEPPLCQSTEKVTLSSPKIWAKVCSLSLLFSWSKQLTWSKELAWKLLSIQATRKRFLGSISSTSTKQWKTWLSRWSTWAISQTWEVKSDLRDAAEDGITLGFTQVNYSK